MVEVVGTIMGAVIVLALCVVAYLCLKLVWSGSGRPQQAETDADFDARSCVNCGYDLRGTGDRCPECGTVQGDERRYLRALATEWPDAPINPVTPGPTEVLVQLGSRMKDWEADLIVQQLNARGVWAESERDQDRRKRGLHHCSVVVPQSDLERAKVIVEMFKKKAEPFEGSPSTNPNPHADAK